jgi:phosphatidylserine/phosphatidylglycerophosphate/cardiolipin synthase-like enzyme
MVVHSTFLDAGRFAELLPAFREACLRGVAFDLLWGDEGGDNPDNKNAKAALAIAQMVRREKDLHRRVTVHMRTTGSHAKLLLVDTEQGWIGAVGSCNWLSSPFQSVEATVLLRDPHVVADLATALQRMVGRRGLGSDIATEMAVTARDLRREGAGSGSGRVAILAGEDHDRIMREASGLARRTFFVGSNRLGSTARPGAIMPGEVAAKRGGAAVTVLYSIPSGPVKNRHARALEAEAGENGIRLIRTRKIPLHGKIICWDDDDVVASSLNWASAASDADFPWADIGVHISAPGLAREVMKQLAALLPEIG